MLTNLREMKLSSEKMYEKLTHLQEMEFARMSYTKKLHETKLEKNKYIFRKK